LVSVLIKYNWKGRIYSTPASCSSDSDSSDSSSSVCSGSSGSGFNSSSV